MEAILWKLRTGAPWRDIPTELGSWKTAYNRFNRWSKKGLWQNFFLIYEKKQHDNEQAQQATIDYEKKLTKNGYSSTEVMYGVINMQVELGVVSIEQLDKAVAETRQKYTYVWTRMEIRSILKSLGVTCTTVKLQTTW